MEAKETMTILNFIKAAYPKFQVQQDTLKVWHESLADFTHQEAIEAVKRHIRESHFEPNLHDLIKYLPKQYQPQDALTNDEYKIKLVRYDILLRALDNMPHDITPEEHKRYIEKTNKELAEVV